MAKLKEEAVENLKAELVFPHATRKCQGWFALSLALEAKVCSQKRVGSSFPTNIESELGFMRDTSFNNTREYTKRFRISMPSDKPLYSQQDIPRR